MNNTRVLKRFAAAALLCHIAPIFAMDAALEFSDAAADGDLVLTPAEQRKVAIATSRGTAPETGNHSVAIYPSQVVTVMASKGNAVLVRGNDDQAAAWLPRAVFADISAFRPVVKWRGESQFEVASVDSGQKYFFNSDGTFRAEFDDNHTPRKWRGRLYRKGQVIWAKPQHGSSDFAAWSVFRQLPNGNLCMLNFDTPHGCECVGTYDSGRTAACS